MDPASLQRTRIGAVGTRLGHADSQTRNSCY